MSAARQDEVWRRWRAGDAPVHIPLVRMTVPAILISEPRTLRSALQLAEKAAALRSRGRGRSLLDVRPTETGVLQNITHPRGVRAGLSVVVATTEEGAAARTTGAGVSGVWSARTTCHVDSMAAVSARMPGERRRIRRSERR